MKYIIRIALFSFLFIFAGIVLAAPYLSVAKSNSVSFPNAMLINQAGVGDYIVTNISGSARRIYVRNLPAGFSVITATGASPANCGSSVLADNASCTVRLSYQSNSETTVSEFLPNACPSADYDIGCAQPSEATNFSIVITPTSDMTTLSTMTEALLLVPGRTTQFEVTNSGATAANNVQLNLSPELSQYVENGAVLQCATVGPAENCIFTIPMSVNLPIDDTPITASISASNAPAINLMPEVSGGLVAVNNVLFSAPGTQSITVTNEGVVTLTGLSLSLSPGLTGVSANGGTCSSTLAVNASCTYDYAASAGAYGSATATINYTQGSKSKSTTSSIAVANTSISINDGEDIVGSTDPPSGTFTIENTGNFSWQAPTVTRSAEDGWLTLDASSCSAGAIAPGASCNITYVITALHDLSSVITASGSNVSTVSQNFNPDEYISLGVEGDTDYQHLGYKAVKITNLTIYSETLSDLAAAPPSALSSQVTLCNNSGSNCAAASFAQSDCQNGTVLVPGDTCHLWYQANSTPSLSTTASSVAVSATATPSIPAPPNPLSRNINFTYDNVLYVGGTFTSAGGNSANRMAQWNGTSWSTVGSGMDSGVSALTVLNGDLYAAGQFTSAGGDSANRIALWNGSSWSALGSGASSVISALAVMNNKLYAAGSFTTIGGIPANRVAAWDGNSWSALGGGIGNSTVIAIYTWNGNVYVGGTFTSADGISANNIAQWDGSSWSALGSGLNATAAVITSLGDNLYVGGGFTTAGGSSANRIAQWNGSSWSALGSGMPAAVNALTSTNSLVYAGGTFTTAGGTSANRMAQWNGSSWSALGSGIATVIVNALTPLNNNLYVGGQFTTAGGITVNNIALWNGSSWSALGVGTGSAVRALTIAPSLNLT